jgi:GlcNAc-PI de-N-acetylase
MKTSGNSTAAILDASGIRTLVILLAHADDETAAAPVLARYAREGVQVYMLIATDGSGGTRHAGVPPASIPASPAVSGDDLFR